MTNWKIIRVREKARERISIRKVTASKHICLSHINQKRKSKKYNAIIHSM